MLYMGVITFQKVFCLIIFGFRLSKCSYIRHPGDLHFVHPSGQIQTLAWGVKLNIPDSEDYLHFVKLQADQLGLVNRGNVGALRNYFVFAHPMYYNASSSKIQSNYIWLFTQIKTDIEQRLKIHPAVTWFKQEEMHFRSKRQARFYLSDIKDPYFNEQWHLHNTKINGLDLNVSGLWERNITGLGVTVSVIDDGLEWTNKDLINNYNQKGSWDLNDDDMDPTPSKDGAKNEHGTRCAGEIAAERNDFCGVGVAYEAGISGIKVLDGKMTDSMEATAFHMKLDVNDIYSCSWGPEDDGATIDGPHHLTSMAMEYGVTNGRSGYGAIYVLASGNGGATADNCNFDGYANSIYTITIGAVDEYGYVPYYAEECAAMVAVSLSSGGRGDRNIVTTDWTQVDGSGCTREHTGTSAAAPLAAAVIALMLQVRHCLTWRDIQYLIVITSQQIDHDFPDWHKNAAGLIHSHHHGFGLLNSWKLVSAAKVWMSVPWMSTFSSGPLYVEETILVHPNHTSLVYNLTEDVIRPYFIWIMEYARIRISLTHPRRGQLDLRLISPSGSKSVLSKPRTNDKSADGFNEWVFSTVRCWGEKPIGEWTLVVTDFGNGNKTAGTIIKWELIITGTPMTSNEFQSRIKKAREAAESNILDDTNFTMPCQSPHMHLGDDVKGISEKILQIICFSGVFVFLLAVFETVEYMLCYDDEKRKFKENLLTRFGMSSRKRNDSDCMESTPLITTNGEITSDDLECDILNGVEIVDNNSDWPNLTNQSTTDLSVTDDVGKVNVSQTRKASSENLPLI